MDVHESESESEFDIRQLVFNAIHDATVEALSEIDLEQAVLEGVRIATDECIEFVQRRILGGKDNKGASPN